MKIKRAVKDLLTLKAFRGSDKDGALMIVTIQFWLSLLLVGMCSYSLFGGQ